MIALARILAAAATAAETVAGDRGRGGRWGRRGGRHRGGRPAGGPGGRNLPPSKYASPQGGESRGYDNRGGPSQSYDNRRPEPPRSSAPSMPVSSEEEIILPGESLANIATSQPLRQRRFPASSMKPARSRTLSNKLLRAQPAICLPRLPAVAAFLAGSPAVCPAGFWPMLALKQKRPTR